MTEDEGVHLERVDVSGNAIHGHIVDRESQKP